MDQSPESQYFQHLVVYMNSGSSEGKSGSNPVLERCNFYKLQDIYVKQFFVTLIMSLMSLLTHLMHNCIYIYVINAANDLQMRGMVSIQ